MPYTLQNTDINKTIYQLFWIIQKYSFVNFFWLEHKLQVSEKTAKENI